MKNTMNVCSFFFPLNIPPSLVLTGSLLLGIIWQSYSPTWYYTALLSMLGTLIGWGTYHKIHRQPLFLTLGIVFGLASVRYYQQCNAYNLLHEAIDKKPITF